MILRHLVPWERREEVRAALLGRPAYGFPDTFCVRVDVGTSATGMARLTCTYRRADG